MKKIIPNDFTEEQKRATLNLTVKLIEIAEQAATEQQSLGVALNAVLSAYGNLVTRNGLQDFGATALRIMAGVLEQKGAALLSAQTAGRA